VKPVLVLVVVLVLVSVPAAADCPSAPPLPGPGSVDPFRPPAPKATELNAAAKTLYRQGKWEEARAQYRAAEAADPDFLAPRLNVACSFVRQERFREATDEVRALLERAYVPWAREVFEAADLGALRVRPEMADVRAAMAAAATSWGADLDGSVLFVARQRPPLHVPAEGAGVFILNPHQEVWAFTARTGRYRQITAEDGHVLALARAADGRRIAYVTAEKLVRGAAGGDVALRGVIVRELALASMASNPPARIEGDVRRLELGSGKRGFVVRVEADRGSGRYELGADGALTPLADPPGRAHPAPVVLTGHGVTPAAPVSVEIPCGRGRKKVVLRGGAGAAPAGLPIP